MNTDTSLTGVGGPSVQPKDLLKALREAIGKNEHDFALHVIGLMAEGGMDIRFAELEILALLISIDQRLARLEEKNA